MIISRLLDRLRIWLLRRDQAYFILCRNCHYVIQKVHTEYMQAAKRILRYLRGTIDMKITYQAAKNSMNGYVDADWGGNALDRKSFTGLIFFVNGFPISWESRKQSCVALSSTEAEYMAMSYATKEAIFLRRLLMEIGYSSGESFILNIDIY